MASRFVTIYRFLARPLNGEESLKKLSDPDSDLHQNLINSYMSHTQRVHQGLCESVNFLRYPAHRQTNKQEVACRARYLQNP